MRALGEKVKQKLPQPWFGGLLGAALAATYGLILLLYHPGDALVRWSYDLAFLAREAGPDTNVVIIYLDEQTFDDLHQDPVTFDRGLHAKLLERLKAEGAKLVVFDVLFIDKSRPITPGDQEFFRAIRDFGKVVVGGQLHESEYPKRATQVIPPIDPVRDAAAGWGLVKVDFDTDYGVRRHRNHWSEAQVPSLAWKSAEVLGAEVTSEKNSRSDSRWLNYYSQALFRGVPYSDVVSGKPLPDWLSFRDKVVFIGHGPGVAAYSAEEKEEFRYPWTWLTGQHALGVQLHALTFENLVRHDWLRRLPESVEALLIILSGGLLGFGLTRVGPLAATGICLLCMVIVAVVCCLLALECNLWFPWLIVAGAQVPCALGWSYLTNSIRVYLEKQLLQRSLERYLSPELVKRILKQPALLKPGTEQKTVSILFSDITSFSKISERTDPKDLSKLLNEYYEVAFKCLHETQGTIMNLFGDAIFAIWNAPQEQEKHQELACRAALQLSHGAMEFDTTQFRLPLRTRLGLHTGIACVGNIGSSTRFEYTAISEAVNLASRLEGLNKRLGTSILATRAIQQSVEEKIVCRLVGYFRFAGFDRPVEVHELVGPLEGEQESREWRAEFAGALRQFHRGGFAAAESGFRRTLKLRPGDGPAQFYLEHAEELQRSPPPPGWTGEINLQEK